MLPIIKKEFRNYFITMTGYIFLGFFILITAIFFAIINVYQLYPNYSAALGNTTFAFLIIIPTLTMRLFAEEVRQKTDQLLYTTPITVPQIVLGKYFAACALFLVGMGITVLFPMFISPFGELPTKEIITAFCGYSLLGMCYVAVGLFIASLSDNQIISAVATFAVLLMFFLMDSIIAYMPATRASSMVFVLIIIALIAGLVYNSTKVIVVGIVTAVIGVIAAVGAYFINNLWFDGLISKALTWFSVLSRFNNFSIGIFDLADVVYYLTFAALFVYLTINVIEKRRWK